MDKIRKLIENLAKRIRPTKNEPMLDVHVEEAVGEVDKESEIDDQMDARRLEGSHKRRRRPITHDE